MAATVRELPADVVVRPDGYIEKPLETFPWRLIGFYALTGRSVITFKEELIKEMIAEVPEEIREQNPPDRILLVADNYSSHHAKFTQERAGGLSIEFIFIPPYSPTLNAIEPLWKDLKSEFSLTIFEDNITSESPSLRRFSG